MALFFTFLAYGLFVATYNGNTSGENEFPTFSAPGIEFEDIPANCSGFLDCTEYLGKIFINFVLGIVYVVLLIVEIIRLLIAVMALILTNAFNGINGMPEWVNALFLGAFGVMVVIAIYKSIRKGDTDSA